VQQVNNVVSENEVFAINIVFAEPKNFPLFKQHLQQGDTNDNNCVAFDSAFSKKSPLLLCLNRSLGCTGSASMSFGISTSTAMFFKLLRFKEAWLLEHPKQIAALCTSFNSLDLRSLYDVPIALVGS